MGRDRGRLQAFIGAALAMALALGLFVAGGWVLFSSTLNEGEHQAWRALVEERLALWLLPGLVMVLLAGAAGALAHRRYRASAAQLAEQARVLLTASVPPRVPDPAWPAVWRRLARTIDELAAQREALRADRAEAVAQASRRIEQERRRLAALMSELTQSVVVCNLDGRILLYNQRARLQFRALSDAPRVTAGTDLLGLGRSIYGVFDRELVAHALERLQRRLARGASQPTAQFLTTTRSGQLLRAQMSPVLAVDDDAVPATLPDAASPPVITGFVLMLDPLTREVDQGRARERLMRQLTEGLRPPLQRLQQAAATVLDPGLDPAQRQRLVEVVQAEAVALEASLDATLTEASRTLATHWPLEDIRAADVLEAAARRIGSGTALRVTVGDTDPALWLRIDVDAVLQALCHLAGHMAGTDPHAPLTLSLQPPDAGFAAVVLDGGEADGSPARWTAWADEPFRLAGAAGGVTVREVLDRHAGRFEAQVVHTPRPTQRDTGPTAMDGSAGACSPSQRALPSGPLQWRLWLPAVSGGTPSDVLEAGAVHADSRPISYDFDLFTRRDGDPVWDDRRLSDLAFTVFDTETTGLDPVRDEIVQIGAVRIVNGRLLHGERFDQRVDPRRAIPAASIAIHGITDEMVRGQPTIEEVLPAFHRYAQDSVLVAHNAAFDMRFLQLKEATTGVRFEQPVLDTLLLSEAVHPSQDSHGLERIAERLGVAVIGRHTALGDAMVTAEVFCRLLPLLADRGIHTLAQAMRAAQQTTAARLRY